MRELKQITKIVMIIIFLLYGCQGKNPYPGYSKNKNGIYYHLLKIGENGIKAKAGDFITVSMIYKTIKDSLFFKGKRKFQITEPDFKGSIDECFTMLAEGDSASFIISADGFFAQTLNSSLPSFIQPGSDMKIEMKVEEINTLEDYYKMKEAFLSWIEDFGEYEKVILKQYMEEEKLDIEPAKSGIYRIVSRPGNGKKVIKGDTITFHYEGRFLNGKFFDSTKKRNEPFQFVYGTEWQVIKGMEDALGMMEEGEKSIIIIPSELGFGDEGSSTGLIPPYTSLIFEVELLEVKKGENS
ncbi:MAG: FKBP-type peptidyl-prolyl cis-trans isomerase [Bacteroidales bacterium]|nr:FKBP-type peptidyl-prolyl cis-trans isomerase [Bacteroidales bacterium]